MDSYFAVDMPSLSGVMASYYVSLAKPELCFQNSFPYMFLCRVHHRKLCEICMMAYFCFLLICFLSVLGYMATNRTHTLIASLSERKTIFHLPIIVLTTPTPVQKIF